MNSGSGLLRAAGLGIVAPAPRLRLNPSLILHLSGQPVAQWSGQGHALPLALRDAALLAWLALEGPTPRNRLALLLWPDSQPEAARNALRQRLFQLKRHLGVAVIEGQAVLELAVGVEHDLADAAELLGSEPLELGAEFDAWLASQREQRRSRSRDTLADLADRAEHASDWAGALAHARELLAMQPLSEDAHRRLMRLHYLAGDRAAALLAFDACERMLKHEIGARPSPQTLALLATLEHSQLAVAAPRVPAAVLRPPRLIGRAEAWALLQAAWDGGRLALVSGEGGMGKSRLLGDFAATRGAVVAAGARPGDAGTAYASVSRLLRQLPRQRLAGLAAPLRRELARLLPELGCAPPPLRDALERTRFVNAVVAAFDGVVGIWFDDLHLADEASLELVQALVAACPAHWLVGTRRAEATPAAQTLLQAWLALSDTQHVPLRPLSLPQVAELVDSLALPGVVGQVAAPALLQRSGGNPLFLLEAIKSGWLVGAADPSSALPALAGRSGGVHALISQRITRLSMPAVQLARCAALAVPDFSTELAAHVLQLRTIDLADPWAELEAAQVLVDGAFVHDLVHEAALASVPAPVARALHAEIAAFLAARGGEPARLARHWTQAGRWAEAGRAWTASAQRLVAASRAVEAAAALADAARAFEQAGRADDRFTAQLQRAQLLAENRYGAEGQAAVADLQMLAGSALQALQALDVRLTLAMNRSEDAEVLRDGLAALAAARQQGRTELELHFAVVVARSLCNLRRAAEAVDLLQPYADQLPPGGAVDLRWQVWSALALALDYADRLRDALPAWDAARTLAEEAGRGDLVWKTLADAASTLAKLGQVQRAAEQAERACRLAQDIGDESMRLSVARMTWAHRLRDTGRYARSLDLLESALAGPTDSQPQAAIAAAEHRLALLYQQLGQPARAMRLLAEDRAGLHPGLAMMRQVHRADLAQQLGRDGLPLMRQALAIIDNPDDIYWRIASLFATRLVPPDEGEALATSLAAWASVRERLGVALAGHVRAAACALALGAPARALPHAEAALHLARDRQPDSFYLPELWLVAGQVHAALGQPVRAAQCWRDGAAWVQRVAVEHVPQAFRESFLHRNATNAELRRLAAGATGLTQGHGP